MPLNHTDTDITTLKINSFETLADYQAAYAQGLIDSNELSFIDESLQADWNQSDSTAPDYIKNKPTIGSGGGLSDYDFTHTANTTVSTSTTAVTFAANQRCSAMLTISNDLGLTIACNNEADNYLWIKNTGSAEVDVTISSITKNSTAVNSVYIPSDGITVPAGGLCEIGIIVNADGAFITSRNDLTL